ncbi:hypothetical protein P3T76_011312 [Phytophthora citrophthora]|uniref:Uncharacterized protein n=1 Tax=Phytophthora citrophthora TaxID=4793 RepID=A0AAD9G990_9STRA|nr:hypothetical protein P3T76_011312 [Phytophthora citrophthora]
MNTLKANGGNIEYNSFTGHEWALKDGEEVLLEYLVDAQKDGKKQFVTVPLAKDKASTTKTKVDQSKTKDEL